MLRDEEVCEIGLFDLHAAVLVSNRTVRKERQESGLPTTLSRRSADAEGNKRQHSSVTSTNIRNGVHPTRSSERDHALEK